MIRVGTDCSGIEAPIQALQQLGIPFRHIFSCEIDKFAVESIKANYYPEIIFEDMTKRKVKDIPNIDLYICGFPCQSFSLAGKREGTDDPRGTIFWQCLKVIKSKLPKVFILENVKGLLSINRGDTFNEIISSLEKIKKYNIYWKILNTKDYGIPQCRDRIFIVGIRDDIEIDFEWPKKKSMKKIENYIDWNDTKKIPIPSKRIKEFIKGVPKDAYIVDMGFSNSTFPNSNLYCPCLNTNNKFWIIPLQRRANIKELLQLQGFPKNFKQVVSDSQMKKQIGNSMSVNVLKEIFKSIYY